MFCTGLVALLCQFAPKSFVVCDFFMWRITFSGRVPSERGSIMPFYLSAFFSSVYLIWFHLIFSMWNHRTLIGAKPFIIHILRYILFLSRQPLQSRPVNVAVGGGAPTGMSVGSGLNLPQYIPAQDPHIQINHQGMHKAFCVDIGLNYYILAASLPCYWHFYYILCSYYKWHYLICTDVNIFRP